MYQIRIVGKNLIFFDDLDSCIDVVVVGLIPYLGYWQLTTKKGLMDALTFVDKIQDMQELETQGCSCTCSTIDELLLEMRDFGLSKNDRDNIKSMYELVWAKEIES